MVRWFARTPNLRTTNHRTGRVGLRTGKTPAPFQDHSAAAGPA